MFARSAARLRHISSVLEVRRWSGSWSQFQPTRSFTRNASGGQRQSKSALMLKTAAVVSCFGALAFTQPLQAHAKETARSETPPPFAKPKETKSDKDPVAEKDLVDTSALQVWNRNWDRRHHIKPRSKCTRYIVLIRHGQYNTKEKLDADRKLTDLGHQQAEALVERVASLPWKPDKIWCSTMTRARQTTAHFKKSPHFSNITFVEDPNLREGRPCQPTPVFKRYTKAQVERDGNRIDKAFETLFHRASADQKHDTYDVVVCHANVIRYFVCRALQLPPEAWLRFSLPHCSMTIIALRPGGTVSVRCVGDSGFLDGDQVTTK